MLPGPYFIYFWCIFHSWFAQFLSQLLLPYRVYFMCQPNAQHLCAVGAAAETAHCPNEHMLPTTCVCSKCLCVCVCVWVCVPWPPLQLAFIMPVDNFRPHIWTMRNCREFYALLLPFLCVLTCVRVCLWVGVCVAWFLDFACRLAFWPCSAQSLCEILIEFLHFIMRIWQQRAEREASSKRGRERGGTGSHSCTDKLYSCQ